MEKEKIFSFIKSVTDQQPKPLTDEAFDAFFKKGVKQVKNIAAQMQQCQKGSESWNELKKQLPAIIWQGKPKDPSKLSRHQATFDPTGMLMLDIDKPSEDARIIYQTEVQPKLASEHVRLVNISPGRGLKILCDNDTGLELKDATAAKAAKFGPLCSQFLDKGVFDISRINFVPLSPDDVLYIDEEWFKSPTLPSVVVAPSTPVQKKVVAPSTTAAQGTQKRNPSLEQLLYVQKQYVIHTLGYEDGIIPEGGRNSELFKFFAALSNVCTSTALFGKLESYGLPEDEFTHIFENGWNTAHKDSDKYSPHDILQYMDDWELKNNPALAAVQANAESAAPDTSCEDDDEEEDDEAVDGADATQVDIPIPFDSLPRPLKRLLDVVEDYQKPAALAGIFSMLSALGNYMVKAFDGRNSVIGLLATVTGKAACGKGCLVHLKEILFGRMMKRTHEITKAQGMKAEELEELKNDAPAEYAKICKLRKEGIRLVDSSISEANLCEKLAALKEHTLFLSASEIDTINKRGFMNITEILRKAFEGEEYSRNTNSTATKNVYILCTRLAAMFSGTEEAVSRFYNKSAIENGTVSRIWFERIEKGDSEPYYNTPNSQEQAEIDKMVDKLDKIGVGTKTKCVIELPETVKLIKAEQAKIRKASSDSPCPRTEKAEEFAPRCGSMALRAAAILSAIRSDDISNPIDDERIHKFALYVFRKTLNELLIRYLHVKSDTETLEQQRKNVCKMTKKVLNTFDSLPQVFTRKQLIEEMKKNNPNPDNADNAARQAIHRWKKARRIQDVEGEKKKYKKVNVNVNKKVNVNKDDTPSDNEATPNVA